MADPDIHPHDEHVMRMGEIAMVWSTAQQWVFQLFVLLSGMDHQRADAVFFSIMTDRAQRDMTSALAKVALASNVPLSKKIVGGIGDLSKLAGKRNGILHAMWTINQPDQKLVKIARSGEFPDFSKDHISEMVAITEEIRLAGQKLLHAWLDLRQHLAPHE